MRYEYVAFIRFLALKEERNMKNKRSWFQAWAIFLFFAAPTPSGWADVGDFGAPFWAMQVGNTWDYTGTNSGSPGTWSYRTEV